MGQPLPPPPPEPPAEAYARRPLDRGPRRRDRLELERIHRLRQKREALDVEVRRHLQPQLGPAGRPMDDAGLRMWRRRQVDAYLAAPPWQRAWRTWRSWSVPHRLLIAALGAVLWTVAILPLRIVGVASLHTSEVGLAALLLAAPGLALVPPWQVPRFVLPVAEVDTSWQRSRISRSWRRLAWGAGGLVVAGLGALALFGPGPGMPRTPQTAAHVAADEAVVRTVIANACGRSVVPVGIGWRGGDNYVATLANDARVNVEVLWSGRSPTGIWAGGGRIVGPRPVCVGPVRG